MSKISGESLELRDHDIKHTVLIHDLDDLINFA